jgi:hypothetical protein
VSLETDKAKALELDPTIDVRPIEGDARFGVYVTWMKSPLIAALNTEAEAWARAAEIAASRNRTFVHRQSRSIPLTGKITLKREFNAFGPARLD